MKPSLLAACTPFVLGSLALHMLAAAFIATLPSPRAPEPAGPLVYSRPGGELDTRPPGEPDFYLVWPRHTVKRIPEDCGPEAPPPMIVCPFACPELPSQSALEFQIEEEDARFIRLRLEYAATRAHGKPDRSVDAAHRVPGRRSPAGAGR